MSTKMPYLAFPGAVAKILVKIKEAKTPDRFTQDFLESTLGFKGGTYRAFIPLAKKLGLLNSDGTPSELYKKFRNPATSHAAIAAAIKQGYQELYSRNENTHTLSKDHLKGLIVEATGLDHDNKVVQCIQLTFENLKKFANFDSTVESKLHEETKEGTEEEIKTKDDIAAKERVDLNLCYTINLVLPKTDDPAVFNAIFKALRENLIRR